MAARLPTTTLRALSSRPTTAFAPTTLRQHALLSARSFQTSRPMMADTVVSPKKPIGAFRGSLFGFLLGTVLAGGGLYYYVVDEYKVSNELLVEDIYALQSAVQRLEGYVKALETEVKTKK
ncbi:hypothetical protein CLAFUW4_12845 [Fulvia fulva]|uniref:Uncharacterized protein n=1 Tax=Passalora fulva TaxID=5499 RepID=A0A9Q8PJE2_PASFU|nr:uncharacterized protein CLAFUR5_12711 [Fulvia fulva]KAK4611898.1 hypothetical protein CLAFUR4_12849 [Fulvia fulva]KAK4612985.1 hypothetical protein CLAFUR0_12855 [Fulvia fulva]UJO23506.1 hypothetical protein CLAFUR5_12711 [Fulvia fulva]WPV21217.1 hypothetical protein CLAFUW4_12845 [Fulvia fulva]WPV36494.1 hypothetical protein CLAFUW7_12853 [Fulvia fulva]